MKRIIIICALLTLLSASVLPAEKGDGGGPAVFMQYNVSARVMGMGGAFAGIADDAVGMFYNPAGTAQLEWNAASATYRKMDFDKSFGTLTASFKAREMATISIGLIHASDGEFVGRDNEGDLTGEDLSYSGNVVALCFARGFGKLVSLGATGKYYITKLANITVNTVEFDLGAMLSINRKNYFDQGSFFDEVRLGAVVKNLGGVDRWNTGDYYAQFGGIGVSIDDDHLIAVKSGLSVLFMNRSMLVGVDVEKYEDQDIRFSAGGEYTYDNTFALRAGYADGRLALGGGVKKTFIYYSLSVDYAFASAVDGEAPDHLFTIGFAFR